jgi:hypothetical protein
VARLGISPIVEDCALATFRTWPGRQIVRPLFDRTGQEPQIVIGSLLCLCRFSFTISLHGFHMISGW